MLKVANLIGLVALSALAPAAHPTTADAESADVAEDLSLEIIFEKNVTDDDAEIVLSVDSDFAIDRFILFGPSHRPVLMLSSDDGQGLGLAKLEVESAEPAIAVVMAAYPEGTYLAMIRSADRSWRRTSACLTHLLPATPVLTSPANGDALTVAGSVIAWESNPDVESWTLEIENDDLGRALEVTLPGAVTSFAVPDGFLVAGEEFDVGLGGRAESGNVIVVEASFDVE